MSNDIEITQIEIRKVENGYLVQAVNCDQRHMYATMEGPKTISYVAESTDALLNIIRGICDGPSLVFKASIDQRFVERAVNRNVAPLTPHGAMLAPNPVQQFHQQMVGAGVLPAGNGLGQTP